MCHYIPCHEFWGGWVAGETGGLYVNHLCVSSSVLVSRFCPKKYFLITFATKFSMVVHCQEPKCHVKRIYCCLPGQVCHVRSASQKNDSYGQFGSSPLTDWSRRHDRLCSRDSVSVFSAGGHCEQFTQGQGGM